MKKFVVAVIVVLIAVATLAVPSFASSAKRTIVAEVITCDSTKELVTALDKIRKNEFSIYSIEERLYAHGLEIHFKSSSYATDNKMPSLTVIVDLMEALKPKVEKIMSAIQSW